MSDMKDFVDASDFQRWAKATLVEPDFTGKLNFYGCAPGLNKEWVYDDKEIERYWRCWRNARDGYIPYKIPESPERKSSNE